MRNILTLLAVLLLIIGLAWCASHRVPTDHHPGPAVSDTPVPPAPEPRPEVSDEEPEPQLPMRPADHTLGSLRGRAIVGQSGAACVGAEARLSRDGTEVFLVLTTDDLGRFSVPKFRPGKYYVRLLSATNPQVFTEFTIVAGEETRLELAVPAGNARIFGRVTDRKTGHAVEGALVSTYPNTLRHAVTDAQGRYEILGLGAESTVVSAGKKGCGSDVKTAEGTPEGLDVELNFKLVRGGSVEGRVVGPDDEPIADALVGMHLDFVLQEGENTVRTDAEGKFTIEEASPKLYSRIYARREGLAVGFSRTFAVSREEVAAGIEVRLPRPGAWSGRVLDPTGNPVAGALLRCWVRDDGEDRHYYHIPVVRSDRNGRYRHTDLPPGTLGGTAWAQGFKGVEFPEIVLEEGGDIVAPDLSLEVAAELSGRVIDDLEHPIESARVFLYPQDIDGPIEGDLESMSDGEGRFRIGGLPEGSYHLWISKKGHLGIDRELIRTGEPGRDFLLPRTGSIAGRVVFTGSNRGAEKFRIGLYDSETGESFYRRAPLFRDSNGRFELDELPEGTYEIEAFSGTEWITARQRSIRIGKGAPPEALTLVLQESCTLSGVLLDPAGRPTGLAQLPFSTREGKLDGLVRISLLNPEGVPHLVWVGARFDTPSAECFPLADGRFEFKPISPGNYLLVARSPDGLSARLEVTVGDARDMEVTLRLAKKD
jgi:protocatechuate 3,4-dioxygenase beta subunit